MKKQNVSTLEIFKFVETVTLTSFSTMYIYNFKKNYVGFTESHRQYELLVVNKGSIVTEENGKKYIVRAGQAFLHKPYSIHRDKNNGCVSQVSIISFLTSTECLSKLFNQVISLTNEQLFSINSIFAYASKHILPTNQFWFSGQKNMILENTPFAFLQIIKNKLELFFISLLESKEEKSFEKTSSYTSLTNKIVTTLKMGLHQKFDLEKIANELNYSKNYLCRHFKKNTGMTISGYFYDLKLSEAKTLLTETDESLNQISELLGFDTVQYFSLWFKKNAGLSPSVFRKNVQKVKYY